MKIIILYYCLVPFLIMDGIYLIWRSAKALKIAHPNESITIIRSWHLAGLIIGSGILIVGSLLMLGVINP